MNEKTQNYMQYKVLLTKLNQVAFSTVKTEQFTEVMLIYSLLPEFHTEPNVKKVSKKANL